MTSNQFCRSGFNVYMLKFIFRSTMSIKFACMNFDMSKSNQTTFEQTLICFWMNFLGWIPFMWNHCLADCFILDMFMVLAIINSWTKLPKANCNPFLIWHFWTTGHLNNFPILFCWYHDPYPFTLKYINLKKNFSGSKIKKAKRAHIENVSNWAMYLLFLL